MWKRSSGGRRKIAPVEEHAARNSSGGTAGFTCEFGGVGLLRFVKGGWLCHFLNSWVCESFNDCCDKLNGENVETDFNQDHLLQFENLEIVSRRKTSLGGFLAFARASGT